MTGVQTCALPISQQTVSILIDELIKAYEILRFKATNDVIAYFEEQVRITKQALNREEDDLMNYNVQERVINYPEETKALAITRYEVEDRLEDVEKAYESATARRKMLEDKMDIRAQIIRSNTNLLQELEKVSTLNQSIMEREIFTSTQSQENNPKLYEDKIKLQKAEENISHLSDNLNEYNFSKEGVGINDMVIAWLTSCIDEAKAKAQLQVLLNRQKTIFDQYSHMSPIGTQVNRDRKSVV